MGFSAVCLDSKFNKLPSAVAGTILLLSLCAGLAFASPIAATASSNTAPAPRNRAVRGLAHDSSGVDWGSLTASDVGELTQKQLSTMTEADADQLTPSACAGWTSIQLQAYVPPAAIGGFSPQCVAYLTSSACGGLGAVQFSNLSPEAVSAISATCMSNLPFNALASMSEAQAGGLTATQCSALPGTLVMQMSPWAFSGITPDCAGGLGRDACDHIQAAQFWHLTKEAGMLRRMPLMARCVLTITNVNAANAVGGLSQTCWANLGQTALQNATAAQLSSLSSSCGFWGSSSLRNLAPRAWGGISTDCARNIQSDSCQGMHALGLHNLQPPSFGALTADCIREISPNALASVTADEVSNMMDSCTGITASFLRAIPPEANAGFSQSVCCASRATSSCSSANTAPSLQCVAQLQNDGITQQTCSGFTPYGWYFLTPSAVSGMKASCVQVLNPSTMVNATAKQMTALSDSACSGITAAFLRDAAPPAYAGFTSDCVSHLTNDGLTCTLPA